MLGGRLRHFQGRPAQQEHVADIGGTPRAVSADPIDQGFRPVTQPRDLAPGRNACADPAVNIFRRRAR